ncbi:MAG: carboxypeptidase regulatory-like domain-containing protein, partial [Gemmatimonadetes bacterium]|nr:carboxypeptidase regulatory-like domain-containing protein [Gemmatimonadota bacterium]
MASAVLVPTTVFAQGSITGVVRDSSGAVLPGVTVEAESPAIIERVRTAVTDGTGQYRITELRPGAYSVTFTLAGFNTFKREGVQITGSFNATIDAELRVGALAETITVTGETPIVDVQSTTRQRVMDQEAISTLPTGRNMFNLGVLVPGLSISTGGLASQDVGGALGPETRALVAHGGRTNDQRFMMNGVSLSSMIGGGWGGGA